MKTSRILAGVAALSVYSLLVAAWATPTLVPAAAAPAPFTPRASQVIDEILADHPTLVTDGLRANLDAAVAATQERTAASKSAGLTSADITAAVAQVAAAVASAVEPLPFEPQLAPEPQLPRIDKAPNSPTAIEAIGEQLEQSREETASRIDALNVAAEAWEKAVAAEKARQQQLAAARAAAQANYGRPGETHDQRLDRILATLPFSFDIRYGTCSISGALGCYQVGSSYAVITPLGMTRSDCRIRRTIAHEYRHYQQWITGKIDITNIDREWLEADADAWSAPYGC
jgi:hypothetical protein